MQLGGSERELFANFYRKLFDVCPEVKEHFASIDMERQCQILNDAIHMLLDFQAERGNAPLRDLAARHKPFGLTRRHYDLFLTGLLEAIAESGIDAAHLAAWQKTLTPAVDFICSCLGVSGRGADRSRAVGAD